MRLDWEKWRSVRKLFYLLDSVGIKCKFENLSIAPYADGVIISRKDNEPGNVSPHRIRPITDFMR